VQGDLAEAQPLVDAHMRALGLEPVPVRFVPWKEALRLLYSIAGRRWSTSRSTTAYGISMRTSEKQMQAAIRAAHRKGDAEDRAAPDAEIIALRCAPPASHLSDWNASDNMAFLVASYASWLVVGDLLEAPPLAPLVELVRLGYVVGAAHDGEFWLGVKSPPERKEE
jgi:hypothetical protein